MSKKISLLSISCSWIWGFKKSKNFTSSLLKIRFSSTQHFITRCTPKRNKCYLTGQRRLSKMLINLAVTENFVNKVKVPTLPRPLIGTFIRFIKAAIIAIKNCQIYIFLVCLYLKWNFTSHQVFPSKNPWCSINLNSLEQI